MGDYYAFAILGNSVNTKKKACHVAAYDATGLSMGIAGFLVEGQAAPKFQ